MESLDGIPVFAKVVETGGFTAAARELGLSKSAVSKQVARLEERLGARLLNRTTRRMSPTEVGRAFYERCRRIVDEIEDAEGAVMALQDQPRGTLRVNGPMSFGVRHLAPAIAAFMSAYPDLRVELELNDRMVDVVDEGYDVTIRIARLPDSALVARKLAPMRPVVCAAPSYWEAHGMPDTPDDLRRHNCLLYAYLMSGTDWRFVGPNGVEFEVPVSGSIRANNGDALAAAGVAGLGVLRSPSFIVWEYLRSGQLVAVLPEYGEPGTSIYAVYPHSRHLSTKVRVFVDFLVDRFGPEPYWDDRIRDVTG